MLNAKWKGCFKCLNFDNSCDLKCFKKTQSNDKIRRIALTKKHAHFA